MRNRWFGVEIEFDSDGLGREGVANLLRREFDRQGLQQWYWMDRMDYDGSEIELKTPKLRGKNGFKKLKIVMDTLSKAGCFTTEDDGLHVHHDAPEFKNDMGLTIQLVKNWKANSHLIYRFVDEYRTGDPYYGPEGNYWACPKWSDHEIAEMERWNQIPNYTRHDLNIASLSSTRGTIEIRLHEGTLYYPDAEAWILFGQRFLDHTIKRRNWHESGDEENLLKKVQMNPRAKKILLDKSGYSTRNNQSHRLAYLS